MKEHRIHNLYPIATLTIGVLAACAVAMAQDQAPGGWRHVGDPAPAPPAATAPNSAPGAGNEAQDPTEPVERSDQYGQPAAATPSPAAQDPAQAAPPQYQPQYQRAPNQPPAPQYQQRYQPAPNQPANRPAYGLPATLTLQPGTFFTVRINQALSSAHNQVGDPFTATLMQPIIVNGVVVANRGQSVYGRVALVEKHHGSAPSRLGVELTGLTLADGSQAPIKSQLVARQGPTTPGGIEAGTIVGTTAVGAAIGGAAAWGTGAAIGAGAGAIAGIATVLATHNHPSVIYPETALTFRIDSPVTIATDRAPQAFRYVGPEDYNNYPQQQLVRARPPAPYASPYYGYGSYYGYPYPYYYPYYWGPGFGAYFGGGFYGGFRGGFRRW